MITENGIITSASIFIEDHGILTSYIHIEMADNCHQGFGGYSLSGGAASIWIRGVLDVLELDKWEALAGRPLRIKKKDIWGEPILSIGHIIKNQWFTPAEAFKELGAKP